MNIYKDKKVLITGGLGFIGANLAEKLVALGSHVTILSNEIEDNWHQKNKISSEIVIVRGDITDLEAMKVAVSGQDSVFHLAGLSGAPESNNRPLLDLEINCKGSLNVLEACRLVSPNTRILFPSSQLVYGSPTSLPVNEDAKTSPTSIYGTHKLTIENYFRLYHEVFGLKTVSLRIPNPYGPRQSLNHTYGIVNYFLGLALRKEPIKIYGSGEQLRDYIFIDDLVDAMLLVNSSDKSSGKTFNVSGNAPICLKEMAQRIKVEIPETDILFVDYPADVIKTEIGDIYLDSSLLRKVTGWEPKHAFKEGIIKTIKYYR